MTRQGLWWQSDPDSDRIFVCDPIKVVAHNRDDASKSWGLIVCWHDPDGRPHQWAVPRTLLVGDGLDLQRGLVDGGLDVGTGTKARNLLTSFLMRIDVKGRARAVATTGWHGATYVFPDPGDIIEGGESETVIMQSEGS